MARISMATTANSPTGEWSGWSVEDQGVGDVFTQWSWQAHAGPRVAVGYGRDRQQAEERAKAALDELLRGVSEQSPAERVFGALMAGPANLDTVAMRAEMSRGDARDVLRDLAADGLVIREGESNPLWRPATRAESIASATKIIAAVERSFRDKPYVGPWAPGERAEYTDESIPGVIVRCFDEFMVEFQPDEGESFTCSDDHLIPE